MIIAKMNQMNTRDFTISGNIVDVVSRKVYKGTVIVRNGIIAEIRKENVNEENYILPGLIDSHIHVESSMLIPSEFARLAVVHGTVATVSDPHEIANVLGIPGVKFMIENGKKAPFKFNFGAPSCVPATPFETSGAVLGVKEIEELLSMEEVKYLSEMMNYPGVLFNDPDVMAKLALAKKFGKPIDGHAPGLRGEDAKKYVSAGISTDHECFTIEEARDKIKNGMLILIREGSAAKNFEALSPLFNESPEKILFCSDDKHPNDLVEGHINQLVKRSLKKEYDFMDVIRSCTFNPVKHYNLNVGLLQPGDPADLIVIDNLHDFNILETYVDGTKVAEKGKTLISSVKEVPSNKFEISPVHELDLLIKKETGLLKVVKALDGQLITGLMEVEPKISRGYVVSNPDSDILKIVVKNRYNEAPVSVGFISNFGINRGALASCVAHDSHNIVAVGTDDTSITKAINLIVESKGGISLIDNEKHMLLPLPFAGIMSGDDGFQVARQYDVMDKKAKEMGSKLGAPYMTLSFMALLVIPALKLSDKGLFDGNRFSFTHLFQQ